MITDSRNTFSIPPNSFTPPVLGEIFDRSGVANTPLKTVGEQIRATSKLNGALGFYLGKLYNSHPGERDDRLEDLVHPHGIYGRVTERHIQHERVIATNANALQRKIDLLSPITDQVAENYELADKRADDLLTLHANEYPENSYQHMVMRAAARIMALDPILEPGEISTHTRKIQFPHDLDNTLTDEDVELANQIIPGAPYSEWALDQHGRESFGQVQPFAWGPLMERYPKVLESAGSLDEIKLRPGTNEFLSYQAQNGHKPSVLSAGHKFRVEGTLHSKIKVPKNKSEGEFTHGDNESDFISIDKLFEARRTIEIDNVNSNNKTLAIQEMAGEQPESPVFPVVDGSSDKTIFREASARVMAGCLVLHEGSAEAEVKRVNRERRASGQREIVFFPYRNHHDSIRIVSDIEAMAIKHYEELRPRKKHQGIWS